MQTRFLEEPLSIIALNRYIPVSAISVVSKACYLVIKFILLPKRELFIQYTVLTNQNNAVVYRKDLCFCFEKWLFYFLYYLYYTQGLHQKLTISPSIHECIWDAKSDISIEKNYNELPPG